MRRKDESKKPIISDFINAFYYEHDKVPSVREIVEGTGIPLSTVHRYLRDMQEKGELSYNGYRSSTGTCSAHYIRAVVLEQLVWKHMQMVIDR